MTTHICTEQSNEEFCRIEGRAEIVDGCILQLPALGDQPASASGAIFARLKQIERCVPGAAFVGTVAFIVDLPHRKSFSPNVSFYTGQRSGMKFPTGAPVFAVEIRSDEDHPCSYEFLAKKRADYFAAGTKVVWDVDLESEEVVRVYRSDDPDHFTVYRRGDVAEAEPAVPGWQMPVDELFE